MPAMDHHLIWIFLAIGLGVAWAFRFVLLMAGLLIMIKVQKFDFAWLPLIGSAALASALDLIPLAGHFIAVPVLYLCVWKSVRCDSYKDATFTVGISYALVRCATWILAAYTFTGFHPKTAQNNFDDDTNLMAFAEAQSTNQTVPTESPPVDDASNNKTVANISIRGFSRGAGGAMVTFQYGVKDYTLSLGEGMTISTDNGMMRVHFLEAGAHDITLDVDGQKMKYALKE